MCKFRRMTKTIELCKKNFPQMPLEDLIKDMQDYPRHVIASKQTVLEMDHIPSAVKIEVLTF
jgi:hypothetical protein